jgi:tripartite-type tricarboxylate transporter receptor subunit TctC
MKSMINRRTLITGIAAAPLVMRGASAQGAEWVPSRPIRLVVGFAAGGSTDTRGD